MSNIGNAEYTKVQNTIYDSKVLLEGLRGVLPPSFRVIEGVITPRATGVYQVYHTGTTTAVQLDAASMILYSSIAAGYGEDLTTDNAGTAALGLAATAGGASATAVIAARSLAQLNAGTANIADTNALRVAAHTFPVVTVANAFTAGSLRVLLIVV